jgi:deferrochelatase/peroxidase EfeB
MKFTGKWIELKNIILSEVTQSQKNTPYVVTDKWILAQKSRILNIQFTDHIKSTKKKDQNVDASVLLRRVTNYSQEEIWRQSVEQRLKERPSRDCPT